MPDETPKQGELDRLISEANAARNARDTAERELARIKNVADKASRLVAEVDEKNATIEAANKAALAHGSELQEAHKARDLAQSANIDAQRGLAGEQEKHAETRRRLEDAVAAMEAARSAADDWQARALRAESSSEFAAFDRQRQLAAKAIMALDVARARLVRLAGSQSCAVESQPSAD